MNSFSSKEVIHLKKWIFLTFLYSRIISIVAAINLYWIICVMLNFINNSCFGQFVYYLSKNSYCKPKEEQSDYVVPERYFSSPSCLSISSYDEKFTNKNIIVTWDGEDDPENPRNWPVYQKSFLCLKYLFWHLQSIWAPQYIHLEYFKYKKPSEFQK